MKILYRICLIFSFLSIIFGVSTVLVLAIAKPSEYTRIQTNYIEVDNLVIERREDDRNLTFYYKAEDNFTLKETISVSYAIYDIERRAFVFIVETKEIYIHATVNMGGYASGIVIPKEEA